MPTITPNQRLAQDLLALVAPMDPERSRVFGFIAVAQALKDQGIEVFLSSRSISHPGGLIGACALLIDGEWIGANGSIGMQAAGRESMRMHGYTKRWKYLSPLPEKCLVERMQLDLRQEEHVKLMRESIQSLLHAQVMEDRTPQAKARRARLNL